VLAEFARLLTPAGHIVIAVPGPNTLLELKASWQTADAHTHVNAFLSMDDWALSAQRAGLQILKQQRDTVVKHYQHVRELMAELKQLGAHHVDGGRATGLTGPHRFKTMLMAYERFRDRHGRLPATYDILFLKLTAQRNPS